MKAENEVDLALNPSWNDAILDSIAKRAYFLYLNAASAHGNDLDHWLAAENQTRSERRRRKLQ